MTVELHNNTFADNDLLFADAPVPLITGGVIHANVFTGGSIGLRVPNGGAGFVITCNDAWGNDANFEGFDPVAGGNFSADWRGVPDLAHIGFPIAEANPEAEIVITKHDGSGGLVSVQTEPQPSRPPRKVYQLTPQGQAAFEEWVHQPTPYLRTIRVEFLARLYFFRRLSLPGLEQLVAEQVGVCQEQVARFERLEAEAADGFRRCVLEFRRGQLEAVIRWLDRCLELL